MQFSTSIWIHIRKAKHTKNSTASVFSVFLFSFCEGYIANKRRHYSPLDMFHGHYSTRDWVVHILIKSNFCVRKTLFPVHNAWIWAQFDHSSNNYSAPGRAVHILDVALVVQWNFVDNVWLWSQLDHGEAHLGSRSFVQRGANNAETVLFTMLFAFVLYGHKAYKCNITWPIAHEANRCKVWTSCTGGSWKCPFLCIMRNFGYSWLTHIQILLGLVRTR